MIFKHRSTHYTYHIRQSQFKHGGALYVTISQPIYKCYSINRQCASTNLTCRNTHYFTTLHISNHINFKQKLIPNDTVSTTNMTLKKQHSLITKTLRIHFEGKKQNTHAGTRLKSNQNILVRTINF